MKADAAPVTFYDRWAERLGRLDGRTTVLVLCAFLSLPSRFSPKVEVQLDPAWRHSLQAAITGGAVFGKDFLFTYGPLGFLFTRSPVNKVVLLFYDFFVLASLVSIYRRLLPRPLRTLNVIFALALAATAKAALTFGPEAALFILAGYWLWRLYADDAFAVPLVAALAASFVLFFGKANYGLIMTGLIPAYSVGLIVCGRDWRKAAGLAVGFGLLVLGMAGWGPVELKGYLHASLELARGYDEAMHIFPRPLALLAAALAVGGVVIAALASFRPATWRNWLMICPFLMLDAGLLYKNAFTRADLHFLVFLSCLPLLLAVWNVAFPNARCAWVLLGLFVLAALCQLETFTGYSLEWFAWTPLKYAGEFCAAPWRQNGPQLASQLREAAPQMVLPNRVLTAIGRSSVDAMPMDSDLPLINDLNAKERPTLQSYAAYTPWLDGQNARFLSTPGAPEFIIYIARSLNTIDDRVAVWDESMTKRALLENYLPALQFQLDDLWVCRGLPPESARGVLLRRSPSPRVFEAMATNSVTIALDQPFAIPASTNYEFLWLDVPRSRAGRLVALASQPPELRVESDYSDGSSLEHRAILPILKTGVLVNYRVESSEETERWVCSQMTGNAAVRSIRFKTLFPWAFESPFQGRIVTCRLVRQIAGPTGATSDATR